MKGVAPKAPSDRLIGGRDPPPNPPSPRLRQTGWRGSAHVPLPHPVKIYPNKWCVFPLHRAITLSLQIITSMEAVYISVASQTHKTRTSIFLLQRKLHRQRPTKTTDWSFRRGQCGAAANHDNDGEAINPLVSPQKINLHLFWWWWLF